MKDYKLISNQVYEYVGKNEHSTEGIEVVVMHNEITDKYRVEFFGYLGHEGFEYRGADMPKPVYDGALDDWIMDCLKAVEGTKEEVDAAIEEGMYGKDVVDLVCIHPIMNIANHQGVETEETIYDKLSKKVQFLQEFNTRLLAHLDSMTNEVRAMGVGSCTFELYKAGVFGIRQVSEINEQNNYIAYDDITNSFTVHIIKPNDLNKWSWEQKQMEYVIHVYESFIINQMQEGLENGTIPYSIANSLSL